ncbi:MAG: hypothetical protein ACREHF_02610 [Rhizomicrobium sp.]
MHEKIELALRQAAEARDTSFECIDQRMKDEWVMVAEMWEELANEYRALQKVRPRP